MLSRLDKGSSKAAGRKERPAPSSKLDPPASDLPNSAVPPFTCRQTMLAATSVKPSSQTVDQELLAGT